MRDKDGKEIKYYNFQNLFEFLGLGYNFEQKNRREYPFHRGKDKVKFNWGQVIIPRHGIEKIVQMKIESDSNTVPKNDLPIKEITMMVSFAYTVVEDDGKASCGIVNQDVSVGFRYDKQYKYGDINKSIYETCYYIVTNAKRCNNFYIFDGDLINEFMSYFVINNQFGFGSTTVCSGVCEYFGQKEDPEDLPIDE